MSLSLRLRMVAARRRLDREIAAGASPEQSRARSVRAAQLSAPGTRRMIGTVLETILDSAEERRRDRSSYLVLEHEAMLEARDGILELAGLLRNRFRPFQMFPLNLWSPWRREALRTNLWLVPMLEVIAAVARQILTTLAAAVITVVGVVFSITIVTLTLASTQFGPRMLRNFIRRTPGAER